MADVVGVSLFDHLPRPAVLPFGRVVEVVEQLRGEAMKPRAVERLGEGLRDEFFGLLFIHNLKTGH